MPHVGPNLKEMGVELAKRSANRSPDVCAQYDETQGGINRNDLQSAFGRFLRARVDTQAHMKGELMLLDQTTVDLKDMLGE